MVRFVRGLFGSKNQDAERKPESKQAKPNQKQKSEAYFLSSDDAKTFGNIEYMRQGMGEKNSTASAPVESKPQQSERDREAQAQRRRADKNLDMFRNMAREIKKK